MKCHTRGAEHPAHTCTYTPYGMCTAPNSLVLVAVGDTPPQRRVAVADAGNAVGVVRAPASAGLVALLIACHTISIWNGNVNRNESGIHTITWLPWQF